MLTFYSRRRQEPVALSDEQIEDLERSAAMARSTVADDVDSAPANREAGLKLPKLTAAGWFWIAYVLGIASALLLTHWGAPPTSN